MLAPPPPPTACAVLLPFSPSSGYWRQSLVHHLHLRLHSSKASPPSLPKRSTSTSRPPLSRPLHEADRRLQALLDLHDLDAALRLVGSSPRPPDLYLASRLVRILCRCGRFADAARVVEAYGTAATAQIYGALADGYCRAGLLEDARRLVDSIPAQVELTAYAFNPLIHTLCNMGRVSDALTVLDDMLCRECGPDVATYSILLEAACRGSGYRQAVELIDFMRSEGCEPNNMTYNVIIDAMCREGDVDEACEFLNSLPSKGCKPNTVNYNTLLNRFCDAERWEDADEILTKMFQENCQPDIVTYNTVLKGLCSAERWGDAEELMAQMTQNGCLPNSVTFNTMISFLCQKGLAVRAFEVFKQMSNRGCNPNSMNYSILINGLVKAGKMGQALEMYNEMASKRINTNNIYQLLTKYLNEEAKIEEAVQVVHKLQDAGTPANTVLYNTILSGLCRNGRTDYAIDLLAYMVSCGCIPDESTYIILIKGLAYEGYLKEARKLLSSLCSRDILRNSSIKNKALLFD